MVDVRRLKMLQMVQLFKCEEDAAQVWKCLQSFIILVFVVHWLNLWGLIAVQYFCHFQMQLYLVNLYSENKGYG